MLDGVYSVCVAEVPAIEESESDFRPESGGR